MDKLASRKWMPVAGFEGDYEVSNDGLVRSRKTGHCRLLKPKYNKTTGYMFVNLYNHNVEVTKTLHRLVAESFIPNPLNLPCVNHIDECKTNNDVENLEWCTTQYNNDYSAYKRRKNIVVYTIEWEKVATFESVDFAASFLGVTKAAVSMAAKGLRHTCAGFFVRLESEVEQ